MRLARKDALPLVILASGLLVAARGWSVTGEDSRAYDIVVEQVGGTVGVTAADVPREAKVGSKLELPSRIVTGEDGNISIRQSRTGVSIAPDSEIEIPAAARRGQLIARMIQYRGSVFYDVEPRPVEKLRIQTPYLVAVVKGTQFNVLVEDGRTTVSLFEGELELRSTDDSLIFDLLAGQIAIASETDGLRVLPMDADGLEQAGAVDVDARPMPTTGAGSIRVVGETTDVDAAADIASVSVGGGNEDFGTRANVSLEAKLPGDDASLGTTVDLGATASVGGGSVDVGVDAGVNLGGDIAGSAVEAGVDVGLDAGADLAGADLGATVDVGVDADVSVGGDLAGGAVDADVDVGLDVGADLAAGDVDVGLDTGLDIAGSTVDVDVDLSVDLDTDTDVGDTLGDVGDTLNDVGDTLGDVGDTLNDVGDTLGDVGGDLGGDLAGDLAGDLDLGDLNLDSALDDALDLADDTVPDAGVDDGADDGGLTLPLPLPLL